MSMVGEQITYQAQTSRAGIRLFGVPPQRADGDIEAGGGLPTITLGGRIVGRCVRAVTHFRMPPGVLRGVLCVLETVKAVSALASTTAEPAAGRSGDQRVEAAALALISPR